MRAVPIEKKGVVPIRYRSAQLLEMLSVSGLFANGASRSLLTRDVYRSETLKPDLGSEFRKRLSTNGCEPRVSSTSCCCGMAEKS